MTKSRNSSFRIHHSAFFREGASPHSLPVSSEKKAGPEAGFFCGVELLLFFVLLHHVTTRGSRWRGCCVLRRIGCSRRWWGRRRRFRSFRRRRRWRRWRRLVAGGQAERKQCCEEERAFH